MTPAVLIDLLERIERAIRASTEHVARLSAEIERMDPDDPATVAAVDQALAYAADTDSSVARIITSLKQMNDAMARRSEGDR